MTKRRPRGNRRDYARTDRVGELLRQIIAEHLERVDDERLDHVTITGVDVDNELVKAVVYFNPLDPEDAPAAVEAFGEVRGRLKAAIGDQAHIRKVPELFFTPDHGVDAGRRVEEILAGIVVPPAEADPADETDGTDRTDETDGTDLGADPSA